MKYWRALLIFSATLSAPSAFAAPCVGAGFETPFPGATDVIVRYIDIPSSQFPGLWQEGQIDGWPFRLFANGDGDIQSSSRRTPEWSIAFTCSDESTDCTSTVEGTPPDAAILVSASLQACLLGKQTQTLDIALEEEIEDSAESERKTPCGKALFVSESDAVTLQRLLALAGANPGPADGIIGPQTRGAVFDVTGEDFDEGNLPETIDALDNIVCEQSE